MPVVGEIHQESHPLLPELAFRFEPMDQSPSASGTAAIIPAAGFLGTKTTTGAMRTAPIVRLKAVDGEIGSRGGAETPRKRNFSLQNT
jgi:hypothetical protein